MKRNDERKFYILSTVTIIAILTVIIIFLAGIFAAGIMIVFNTIKKQPQKVIEAEVEEEEVESDTKVTISIDEWIGWKTLIDANGGLITAPDSNSLIKGDVQGAGYTVNQYAFLQSKFKDEGIGNRHSDMLPKRGPSDRICSTNVP